MNLPEINLKCIYFLPQNDSISYYLQFIKDQFLFLFILTYPHKYRLYMLLVPAY